MTSGESFRKEREVKRDFRRKNIGSKQKERILILTEGQKTEIFYLQKLCKTFGIFEAKIEVKDIFDNMASVDLKHVGSAPMIKEYKKLSSIN